MRTGSTSSTTSDVSDVDAQASDLASASDISLSRFLVAVFRLTPGYEGGTAGQMIVSRQTTGGHR